MAKKTDLQKNLENIWAELQIQVNDISKEAKEIGKKTEAFLRDFSIKGKAKTEEMMLRLKREQLYYNLGKLLAKSPKSGKKIASMKSEISVLDRQIKGKAKISK